MLFHRREWIVRSVLARRIVMNEVLELRNVPLEGTSACRFARLVLLVRGVMSPMGFRFRRSFKVAPGFRLNLSKSGVSTSVGRRELWFTVGPRGTRTTVGIPGTGLSYTEQSKLARPTALDDNHMTTPGTPPADSAASSETSTSSGPMRVFVLLAIIAVVACVFLLARL